MILFVKNFRPETAVNLFKFLALIRYVTEDIDKIHLYVYSCGNGRLKLALAHQASTFFMPILVF